MNTIFCKQISRGFWLLLSLIPVILAASIWIVPNKFGLFVRWNLWQHFIKTPFIFSYLRSNRKLKPIDAKQKKTPHTYDVPSDRHPNNRVEMKNRLCVFRLIHIRETTAYNGKKGKKDETNRSRGIDWRAIFRYVFDKMQIPRQQRSCMQSKTVPHSIHIFRS